MPLRRNGRHELPLRRDGVRWLFSTLATRKAYVARRSIADMVQRAAPGGEATFALAMERRLWRGHWYFLRRSL
jgi:hypothetical protein